MACTQHRIVSTPNSALRCNLLLTTTKLPRQHTSGSISTKFRISYFPQISKPNRRENPLSLYNSSDSSAYPTHLTIHQTQTKSRPLKKKKPPPHHKVCAAVSPNSHHLISQVLQLNYFQLLIYVFERKKLVLYFILVL